MGKKFSISLSTAILLVIANAIGTGIFTTTGFALADVGSPMLVMLVWVAGALYAVVGVICYEELHKIYPGSGGEYHFLSRGLHRTLGYFAGWVSLIAGFSAPIATSAMAFALYFNKFLGGGIPPLLSATLLILAVFLYHSRYFASGERFHNFFVLGKLFGVMLLISLAGFYADWQWPVITESIFSSAPEVWPVAAMAKSFFWVAFAFSGWNAVYYVASELTDKENAAYASFVGTMGVCGVYLAINAILLFNSQTPGLIGAPEVVGVFLENIFGPSAGRWLSFLIAFGLISTTSALFITAPRVYSRMAEDGVLPRVFYSPSGVRPRNSIILQAVVALVILWSLQFDRIISVTGFTLSVCSALAVAVLLFKLPKTNFKFYLALIFCLATFWIAYCAAPVIFF